MQGENANHYREQYHDLIAELKNDAWYSTTIDEVLQENYKEKRAWDDALNFVDELIENIEEKGEINNVIIRTYFQLPEVIALDTTLPALEEAKQCGMAVVEAFRINRLKLIDFFECYRCPVWQNQPRYHNIKLYTYYRCGWHPGDGPDDKCNPECYERGIVRVYAQDGFYENSRFFVL